MKLNSILFALIVNFSIVQLNSQTSEKRDIQSFTKIVATGASNIIYENASNTNLIIEGDPTEIKNIETVVKGNTLYISMKGTFKHPFKIKVTNPELNSLDISGASKFISSNEIKSNLFTLKASGASSAEIPLHSKKISSELEGASNIKLKGITEEFIASLSGASALKAFDLKSINTTVSAHGASTAKVFASQKITTNSSGASQIKFEGEPKEILKKETSISK